MDCVICPGSESRQCILFPLSLNHQSSNLKLSSRLMTILMNSLYSLYFLYSPSESPADFCQKKGSYFVPLSSVYSAWSILYCMVVEVQEWTFDWIAFLEPSNWQDYVTFHFFWFNIFVKVQSWWCYATLAAMNLMRLGSAGLGCSYNFDLGCHELSPGSCAWTTSSWTSIKWSQDQNFWAGSNFGQSWDIFIVSSTLRMNGNSYLHSTTTTCTCT